MKNLLNPTLFLSSVLLAIVISDYLGQKIGLGDPILYAPDELVGYRLKPNQSVSRNNIEILTDHEGFRVSALRPTDIQSSTTSIVFVGDSVTYGGSYIQTEKTFPSLLCKEWNYELCLNGAVNSWGLGNMTRLITHLDLYTKSKPLMIVVTVLPGDELRNIRSLSDTPFWQHRPLWPPAVREVLRFILWRYIQKAILGKTSNPSYPSVSSKKYQLQLKESWSQLFDALKKSDIPSILVVTPHKVYFEEPQKFDSEIKSYRALLDNIKMPNIQKCFLFDKLKKSYEPEWFVDQSHLSPSGHRKWKDAILKCTTD